MNFGERTRAGSTFNFRHPSLAQAFHDVLALYCVNRIIALSPDAEAVNGERRKSD